MLLDEQSPPCGRHPVRRVPFAIGAKNPVGSRRAEREELGAHHVGERQMAVAFEYRDQLGQEGDEAFGTDAIGGRPGDDERVLHRATVEALARSQQRRRRENGMGKEPDSVLARIAGDSNELIELIKAAGIAAMTVVSKVAPDRVRMGGMDAGATPYSHMKFPLPSRSCSRKRR